MARPTAFAYIRVSTEEQATEGLSLDAQERAVRAYCDMRGLALVECIIDPGISAGKPLHARPGGKHLLEALADRRTAAVVALKLDRLFRDCADCLAVVDQWDRQGTALHLVDLGGQAVDTSTAMGRFFLTVMAGAAEMERNLIRERTRAAMAEKKARGQWLGQAPYGFRCAADGVHLEADPREQRILDLIAGLRKDGMSLQQLTRWLNEQHIPARGKRWHKSTLVRIVKHARARRSETSPDNAASETVCTSSAKS